MISLTIVSLSLFFCCSVLWSYFLTSVLLYSQDHQQNNFFFGRIETFKMIEEVIITRFINGASAPHATNGTPHVSAVCPKGTFNIINTFLMYVRCLRCLVARYSRQAASWRCFCSGSMTRSPASIACDRLSLQSESYQAGPFLFVRTHETLVNTRSHILISRGGSVFIQLVDCFYSAVSSSRL